MAMKQAAASSLALDGAALLGGELLRETGMTGGDLSAVVCIGLADGREAVVKSGPSPPTEAAMLQAMAAAGVPVPAVLAVDDRSLVLSVMAATGGPEGAWASLGTVAARLHATHGDGFGWPEDYAFGAVPIDNRPCRHWPTFWAERRLLPMLPHVPPTLRRRIEALSARLEDLLPAAPPPSLLHGDLWAGNVLTANGVVTALIDPACYYGHGEVDLAMLALFARPPAAFFGAYGDLAPGHEARKPLYQLWPAVVHVRLFGAGYFGLVDRLLSSAGV